MNVSCPQCSTTYRVDPAKVPTGGVRARCSACSGVIPVGIAESVARPTPMSMQRLATPERPAPVSSPMGERPVTPPRSATLPPLRPTPRTPWPSVPTPSAPAASVPPQVASAPTAATPHAARPFIPSQTPISVPAYTPPAPAPAPPPPAAPAAEAQATHPTPTAPPAPGERRPINPFLARDPSLRAKRLARALVSDMVAYYPAKHSEGLQRGTLKELFREEIKKSYEEYVAQIGAELARSTTHFQEALNEVLGAGKKIF